MQNVIFHDIYTNIHVHGDGSGCAANRRRARGPPEQGRRRARPLAAQVLRYLGERRPPVTHRDVKPENVVLGGGRAGGRVFLVDFGGVQVP